MVKASRYTTLAATALLLAAACTQLDPGYTYRDDPDAVRISAQVGDEEKSGSFATRSNPVPVSYMPEEEWSFNSGDKVCITADGQPAVVYTLQDGSTLWSPEEGKYLKWNTPTMNFTAWYPAAQGVNADNFTVPADQSDEAKIAAADYMTCSKQITRDGDNPVSLNFERRMARIMVHPTFNNQFNDVDYTVSEVIVCGNTKGYASGSPASGSVEVKAYNNGTFYALLSPTTASNETFIKVKVKKNDGTEEHSLEAKGIIATEAGKSYIVNLTVGKNVASVSRVTVSDWSFKDSITGSEADQIPYVTFSAASKQTFTMDFKANRDNQQFMLQTGEYFEYSVGGGKWVPFTSTVSVDFGGDLGNLRLRGTSRCGTASGSNDTPLSIIKFDNNNIPVACTGDIRTLVDYKNYANAKTEQARFCCLFQDCSLLTSAPDLPATTLTVNCYHSMFKGCERLTEAPDLPAKNLAEYCYASMFEGCTSLTKAPELPATELRIKCYYSMFKDCRSLTTAPELPATELAENCYGNMFEGCWDLTEAPDLPANRLVSNCYAYMFHDCTSLTKAPALPATNLAEYCYGNMFDGCSSLTEAPKLPANYLQPYCYSYMCKRCRSLTEAPELPATNLSSYCYSNMFEECTSLTEAPELPAPYLTDHCYYYMFAGCEKLSKVTMKAQDKNTIISPNECLRGWLEGTGYEQASQSHTLTLANKEVYDCLIELECIFSWRKEDGATIILLDGTTL